MWGTEKGRGRALGVSRGQTEGCGLHQTAPVELQATAEGKQSGLESTKGEMEALGRHQNTLLQLLVCPERPTPVLRAHGKANRDAFRRQEEKRNPLG